MATILHEFIDLSILLIFRHFCTDLVENVPAGVIHYAEHEYNNQFAKNHRFTELSTFHFQRGNGWKRVQQGSSKR